MAAPSDSQSDDGFTLVEGRDGENEGPIGEGGLLSATQQQEDAASINKFLELNVFPCELSPPQGPASPHQQHLSPPPTAFHGASHESSPEKAHSLSPEAGSPAAHQPSHVSTPAQTAAPPLSSTELGSQPASEASLRANPLFIAAHPAANIQGPNTAPLGPSFSPAKLWPSMFLLGNLLVVFLAAVNANWCFWMAGGLLILQAAGLASCLWPALKPTGSTAHPATSRQSASCNEPSKDKVWMLSSYMVLSTLLAVIIFWSASLAGALWWNEAFVQPVATTPSQASGQPSGSHGVHPPSQPEKGPAHWSHSTQQSGARVEQTADMQLSKYVEHLHQQLALKDREIQEQRHMISSICSSQPPTKPAHLRAKGSTEPPSPEVPNEEAEAHGQHDTPAPSSPSPSPPKKIKLKKGTLTPPPPLPSDDPSKPSTHSPDVSNEPAQPADQQQGAAGLPSKGPPKPALADGGHGSAALVPQDMEQAKGAQMGRFGRMRASANALALRQHSSNFVASAAHKARSAAVALQLRGAAAADGIAEIAAEVRRAATASAVAVRQRGASLWHAAMDKAAAADRAYHAASLQVWHAGSNTWLGQRAGAGGLVVYHRAEKFVERVVAAVRAFRQAMRDTRTAVIAARRRMQSRALEHALTTYGNIETAVSDLQQRVAGLRHMGKAAQQQPQQQQQQHAKWAQQQPEQAAEATGRATEGGLLRGRLQQLVRRLPTLRGRQA